MQSKEKGYYDIDIDIDEALVKMGMVDDIFYLRDLKQRKLFLACLYLGAETIARTAFSRRHGISNMDNRIRMRRKNTLSSYYLNRIFKVLQYSEGSR